MGEVEALKLEAIVKTRSVPLSVEEAFDLFTTGMARWWPLATHSIAKERARDILFEAWVGGQIVEIDEDGSRHVWGTIKEIDRPNRVVFSWHPGRTDATEQVVAVTFRAVEEKTELRLDHTGWENLGEDAPEVHEGYTTGWDHVLSRFEPPA